MSSKLQEDLLFAITGDSYGENLHVDTTAKSLVEDVVPAIKALVLSELMAASTETTDWNELVANLQERFSSL